MFKMYYTKIIESIANIHLSGYKILKNKILQI